ncbi:MAG: glycerophosphodiester phosphodiesterase family protein [Hyphomicrobiaceae bacterium]
MLDRSVFIRPIAHRGLHDASQGVIENSGAAFEAAIVNGYGIECDLQPAADGTPVVFHDAALGRLVDAPGLTTDYDGADLQRLTYRSSRSPQQILSLAALLELVAGKVPLLIEVKSDWKAPDERFIAAIAAAIKPYRGPAAIMSFDPTRVAALKTMLPDVPRGIVSGLYKSDWLPADAEPELAFRLSHLLASRPAEPHFFAYRIDDLPTPVTRFVREGLGLPLFSWTVRTPEALAKAREWADAPIFEGLATLP